MEKVGFIYYIPAHNYVGQSVQEHGRRFSQHSRNGKDLDGAYILQTNIPQSRLNAAEAYWIGVYNAYNMKSKYGNHTRGTKALASFFQGMQDMGHA
jgi:hypothetical protein